ncbi:hypothetical protein LIER_06971 [Lithospermum erythrorhizon]|uniref:Uncharacterized protein n=1 Tax=Lithospermum erythrorhizon TaxID=34254 RepID=A0AAV3P7I2_LITER
MQPKQQLLSVHIYSLQLVYHLYLILSAYLLATSMERAPRHTTPSLPRSAPWQLSSADSSQLVCIGTRPLHPSLERTTSLLSQYTGPLPELLLCGRFKFRGETDYFLGLNIPIRI